jgi:thiol-disulfide isomerase/thioredoxin
MLRRFLTLVFILAFPCVLAKGAISSWEALTDVPVWLNTSRALKADDLKGRVLLVDFWTYCCINCMHVFPDLKALEREFGSDLTVIGVHSAKFENEKDRENIRQAILRNELEHPVVDDAEFVVWKHFDVNSWPTLVLIDPTGRVDLTLSGEGHLAELRARIRALVDKFQGQLTTPPLPIQLEKSKAPVTTLRFPSKLAYVSNYEGSPALFISDSNHNRVIGVRPDSGQIFLSVGDKDNAGFADGGFSDARFNHPQGLLYRDKMLYVADLENHALRLIDLKESRVSTLAGQGKQGSVRNPKDSPATQTFLSSPWDIAFYPTEKQIAIAMAGTHQIWTYDLDQKTLNLLAGSGVENIVDGPALSSALAQTSGLSRLDNDLYFVDAETSSLRVLEKGEAHTLIGSGLFKFGFKEGSKDSALLQHPLGLYADRKLIYVADSYNHSIRTYDLNTHKLSTLVGDGKRGFENGIGAKARFNEPNSVIKDGDRLFVGDTNNQAIRIVDLKSKRVSTLEIKEVETHTKQKKISETLPNVIHAPDLTVVPNRPLSLKITLPEHWKINEEAPSFLALFQMTAKGPLLAAQWDRHSLKSKSIQLPALKTPGPYRLQGTFYYCKETKNALCLIESHDQTLKVDESSTISDIVIPLTAR